MFERLLKIFLPVAFGVALQTVSANALGASPVPSVVIAQVQAGSSSGDASATQEFISIYNNSSDSVDVTNWCVSNKAGARFACLTPPNISTTLTLPAHAYASIASDSFAAHYPGNYDAVFTTTNKTSGSLVGGSDTVTLLDADGEAVDSMSWTTSLAGGSFLSRQWANQSVGTLLDTNANGDFNKETALTIPASGLTEEVHIVDVCANLDGVQPTIPDGHGQVGNDCIVDACPNLDGLQADVPAHMRIDATRCIYDVPLLTITELLPNAAGNDDGQEFIELYNPGSVTADLSLYRLQVGPNFEKTYAFAAGSTLEPLTYKAFYNDAISFSLLNTSSRVRLVTLDGQVVSDTAAYMDPSDDQAWAFIDDTWMFTNKPTPGLENLLPTDDGTTSDGVVTAGIKPCAANQYRNPDTNRCRTITTDSGTLKPCQDGQYRSEETNRCRSIASDASSSKPCADDQYRNPATGRCKKIASEDEVKDCGEGRERNPVTKRCRNVVSTASAHTGGVRMVPAPAASLVGWLIASIVAAVALGYALLEWRREILRWLRRQAARARLNLQRLRYNKSNEDNWD